MTRPYPMAEMPFEQEYKQEIAHIYDLLRNICTFKKVRFTQKDNWTQGSDGYYKLQIPCTDFVTLAAFENIDGASDKRANCVIDANKKYTLVTGTYPFDGYLVAAAVNFDDDDTNAKETNNVVVDRELNKNSLNPVTNRAITLAINSLTKQVSQSIEIPASLPASDVYAWAKTKNKPCYSWDEICGKPNVITEVAYKGKKIKSVGNTLILDKLADIMGIPTKLSQLELDTSVFKLADGEGLKNTLSTLIDNDDKLEALIQSQARDLNSAISELQANDDDATRYLDNLNSRIAVLKNTVTHNYLALEDEIAASETRCNEARVEHIEEVKKTINQLAKTSKEEDDILHAQLSALAHECRLHHDMYDAQFSSITSEITKLQASSAEALVELIKSEIATTSKDVAELEGRVENLENSKVVVKASETNGNIVVNNNEIVVYDDSSLQQNIQDVLDDVDGFIDKIEAVEEAIGDVVNGEEFTKLTEDIEKNKEDIETLSQKITSISESAGIKLEESSVNGNITVSYPVDTDESGNVIYGNSQELKVYAETETLTKLQEEANAALTSRNTILPSKVSELENDLNFITRKQAAGLVASATVNFDTAFEDDDSSNITYVKTVNISESQGSVIVNGDDIVVNVEGIGEMQAQINEQAELIAAQAAQITALIEEINQLKDAVNNIPTNTNLEEINNKVSKLETSFKTFIDEDGILSEGEQPLWEKQDQATAVTDSDAMTTDDIQNLYNEIE